MQEIVGRVEGAGCQGQGQEHGCRGAAVSSEGSKRLCAMTSDM